MNDLALKCIQDHRNPIVKLSIPPQKIFFSAKVEDKGLINNYQEKLCQLLRHTKVEKRCNRAQVIWLPEKNIGKVVKIVKNLLKSFGYQNKDGIFLSPEEIMFLLETNRLEIYLGSNSLSVKGAFELLLKTGSDFTRYRIYKRLAQLGYKLVQNKDRKELVNKRKMDQNDVIECIKRPKMSDKFETNKSLRTTSTNNSRELEFIKNIFSAMDKTAPKNVFSSGDKSSSDYTIINPNSSIKNKCHNQLVICTKNLLEENDFTSTKNIYAVCSDDISFYKICNIDLPHL